MQIISFAGLAGAGKSLAVDTAAKWALENGFTPRLESFAGPLKRAATAIGAIKGGPKDALYRKFCQIVGTELVRDPLTVPGITGNNYWVDLMEITFDILAEEEQANLIFCEDFAASTPFHETIVLIDDARYLNEVESVRKYSGINVFLDAARRLTDLDAEWRKHSSEDLARDYTSGKLKDSLFDFSISSNNSSDDLRAIITSMMPTWSGQIAEERIID